MKKEELFILIKSLTKSEKRYFKVFYGQSGSTNNYLRLFDELDKQDVFDESEIRKKFKGEKFLDQLHVTKNYLRQLIMKCLRNYHAKISKDAELKIHLRNLEILFNKELYQHCLTELKRAEYLAATFELKTGYVEVINWKRKIEQAIRPQNYQEFQAILAEQKVAIDNLNNTHDYWKLAVEVSSGLFVDGGKKDVKSPLLSDVKTARSLEARVLYYNTRYIYYLQKNNQEKAVEALEELVEHMEGIPHRLSEDPAMYISSINNLVSFYFFSKKIDKALELINRSKNFFQELKIKGDKKSLLKHILRSHNIELEIYRSHNLFHENMDFILEIQEFVMSNKSKMPVNYLLSFWFQFAYIHFMEKEYDIALKWINLILNNKSKNARLDLLVQTRMLNLMTHLEQKNYFVMRYFVDSTRRFMKKVKGVKPYENILLQFFSRMGKVPEYEWKDNFRKLSNELNACEEFEKDFDLLINYQGWIQKNV